MKLTAKTARAGLAASFLAAATLTSMHTAEAGEDCIGVVKGLSSTYNRARKSGYLAVRTRASSKGREIAELFNGEEVEVLDRNGNWYQVSGTNFTGWAYSKYIRNDCGY